MIILQRKKLMVREVMCVSQGHTANVVAGEEFEEFKSSWSNINVFGLSIIFGSSLAP
jgi:hypothetical protein